MIAATTKQADRIKKTETTTNTSLVQSSVKKNTPVVEDNAPQEMITQNTIASMKVSTTSIDPDKQTRLTNPKEIIETPSVTPRTVQPLYASTSPAGINDEDEPLESSGKKSKLRGFLRKVTRTFEKKTNIDPTDDSDRLLVGGLSLRLK